jgi:hypothetical protein
LTGYVQQDVENRPECLSGVRVGEQIAERGQFPHLARMSLTRRSAAASASLKSAAGSEVLEVV